MKYNSVKVRKVVGEGGVYKIREFGSETNNNSVRYEIIRDILMTKNWNGIGSKIYADKIIIKENKFQAFKGGEILINERIVK